MVRDMDSISSPFKLYNNDDFRTHCSSERLRDAILNCFCRLPHGGITYISELFGCDRKTIGRGIKELKNFGSHLSTNSLKICSCIILTYNCFLPVNSDA